MQIALDPPFRRARESDARAIAQLTSYAGEGMPDFFWAEECRPGETPLDIGARRAARSQRPIRRRIDDSARRGNDRGCGGPVGVLGRGGGAGTSPERVVLQYFDFLTVDASGL